MPHLGGPKLRVVPSAKGLLLVAVPSFVYLVLLLPPPSSSASPICTASFDVVTAIESWAEGEKFDVPVVPSVDGVTVVGCAAWVTMRLAHGNTVAWVGRCEHGCVFRTVTVTLSGTVAFVGVSGVQATWIKSWSAFCTCVVVSPLHRCFAAVSCALIARGFRGDGEGRVGDMTHCLLSPPFLS